MDKPTVDKNKDTLAKFGRKVFSMLASAFAIWVRTWRHIFDFKSEESVKTFFFFFLINLAVLALFALILESLGLSLFLMLLFLATLLPVLALSIRLASSLKKHPLVGLAVIPIYFISGWITIAAMSSIVDPSIPSHNKPINLGPSEFDLTMEKAKAGNADAECEVGTCYLSGLHVSRDYEKAFYWLKKASDHGNGIAMCNLGRMYYEGLGMPTNFPSAQRFTRMAADKGIAEAQYRLGFMYRLGDGVKKDNEKAFRQFRLAAEQGYSPACYVVGVSYIEGLGTSRNGREGVKWIEKCARDDSNSNPLCRTAAFDLAEILHTGHNGIPRNTTAAIKWYEKAAYGGNIDAMMRLGMIYAHGDNIDRNIEKACYWFDWAARKNSPQAMFNLGILFAEKGDKKKARQWLEKAATAGVPQAKVILTDLDSTDVNPPPAKSMEELDREFYMRRTLEVEKAMQK